MNPPITDRQEYEELESVDAANARFSEWDIFQVKYDGIWCRAVIEGNSCTFYSRSGQVKHTFNLSLGYLFPYRIVLIGEYMYGSQWAKSHNREGKFYAYDLLERGGTALEMQEYRVRYKLLAETIKELDHPFMLASCFGSANLGQFWLANESTNEFEGVVLRRWSSTWYTKLLKLKTEIEDDFIIGGFTEGEGKYDGTLGALKLYSLKDGISTYIMNCSGAIDDKLRDHIWTNQSDYWGKVATITGKGRFSSGALRHPTFKRLHADKHPSQCVLKHKS